MEQLLMNLLTTTRDSTGRKFQTSTFNQRDNNQVHFLTLQSFYTLKKWGVSNQGFSFFFSVLTQEKRMLRVVHWSSTILRQSLVRENKGKDINGISTQKPLLFTSIITHRNISKVNTDF